MSKKKINGDYYVQRLLCKNVGLYISESEKKNKTKRKQIEPSQCFQGHKGVNPHFPISEGRKRMIATCNEFMVNQ